MRAAPLLLLVLALTASCVHAGDYRKNRALKQPVPIERMSFNPEPLEPMSLSDLPKSWNWGRLEGPQGPTSLLQPSW